MNKSFDSKVIVRGNKTTKDVSYRVNKSAYERIVKSINSSWPQWKKELCNNELIISANSRKLD